MANLESNRHTASSRRQGLYIAMAAALALLILAAYKVPLFHNEVNGTIVGVSAIHNEAGSKLTAAVLLETGDQVHAFMPGDLLLRQDISAKVSEGRALFGRKSYRIIAYNE